MAAVVWRWSCVCVVCGVGAVVCGVGGVCVLFVVWGLSWWCDVIVAVLCGGGGGSVGMFW